MMQAADAGQPHDLGGAPRPASDHPERRRLLLQGIVNAIVVVILEVISNQPTQMGCVQDDHVVQQFPAATSHPALRHPVLPGTSMRRSIKSRTTWRPSAIFLVRSVCQQIESGQRLLYPFPAPLCAALRRLCSCRRAAAAPRGVKSSPRHHPSMNSRSAKLPELVERFPSPAFCPASIRTLREPRRARCIVGFVKMGAAICDATSRGPPPFRSHPSSAEWMPRQLVPHGLLTLGR